MTMESSTIEILVVFGEDTANYYCSRGYYIHSENDYHFKNGFTEKYYYLINNAQRLLLNSEVRVERKNSGAELHFELARAYSEYVDDKAARKIEYMKKKECKHAHDRKLRKS